MKVLMKPVEMIAWFNDKDYPVPLRFRLDSEDKVRTVIRIGRIISHEEEKLGGNRMVVYRCEGIIGEQQSPFELKYEISTCRWFLFKM